MTPQGAIRRLSRLLLMSPAEIAYRTRQAGSKWLERVGAIGQSNNGRPHAIFRKIESTPALDAVDALVWKGDLEDAGTMLLDRFQVASPFRFFEGPVSDETPKLLTAQMADVRNQVMATAGNICQSRFDLLGYRGLSFGNPVDWHLDPVSGRRAPLVHWSRIDPLNARAVGDSKVVWELNRHQWMVRLGQAFRLTGDDRFGEAFALYVRDWLKANPEGIGINWTSSLEAALRLISWCWALCLFRGAAALTNELFTEMLSGIRAHATHVERYLSRSFSPNTHLTGEALGLFYAGTLFPGLRDA